MKYLKYFEQASAYEAFKNGSDYVLPNVSYVVETEGVCYEPYVPPVPKNVITYYANEKLVETTGTGFATGLHVNVFNSPMISHEFVDGVGTITFEEDITTIGSMAFLNCTGLTGITIPEPVIYIANNAFVNCSGLTEITCHAIVAPSIAMSAFLNIKSGGTLYVPIGGTSNYSAWMENNPHYLGYYNWTIKEM